MILTLHDDNRPWSDNIERADIGILDWQVAKHQLRAVFSDHRVIATLGSLEIVAAPGAEYALPKVHERLGSFIHDLGNSIPDCWMGAKHAVQNLRHIQNEPKNDALNGIWNGTTICIASGPSNAKYLEKIRQIQNQCIIVIADSMWKGCRAAGIDPHFVCVLERDPLLASLVPPDSKSRARLVVPAVAYPPTVDGWGGRRVWWWQQFTDLYRWIAPDIDQHPTGRSAGTMACALSVLLGSRRVYLVGHDLSRGPDGSSHSAHVDTLASTNHGAASQRREPLHEDIVIDGKRTCRFWNFARGDIETLHADNPDIMRILGNDGLDIPGMARESEIELVNPQEYVAGTLKVSPSRAPIDLKAIVKADMDSFARYAPKIQAASETPNLESIARATNMIDPNVWGHVKVADLYKYILGPAYRAASLRGHLRCHMPGSHAAAFRVLLRAIPSTLAMMDRDL